MVKIVLSEEDSRNLKTLAEEVPRLRLLVEELIETLEVLSDEKLMKSINTSDKDIKENRLLSFKELLSLLDPDLLLSSSAQ